MAVHDVARIGLGPLFRNGRILAGVHEKIKRTRLVQKRQECNTRGNLSNNGLNFVVDLFDGFIAGGRLGIVGVLAGS